jgi:hypothetical protein
MLVARSTRTSTARGRQVRLASLRRVEVLRRLHLHLHVSVVVGRRSEWSSGKLSGAKLLHVGVEVHVRGAGVAVVAAWGRSEVGGWTRRQGADGAQVVVHLIDRVHVRGPGAGGERFEARRRMASKKLVVAGVGARERGRSISGGSPRTRRHGKAGCGN